MIKPSPVAEALPPVPTELTAFLHTYMAEGRAKLDPPQDHLLRVEGVTSIVLHRAGRFQVEMIVIAPGTTVPEHAHDDVDSYELALAGQVEFHVNGIQTGYFRGPREDGHSRDLGRYVPIARGVMHRAVTGPLGATFLSVQLWRDGIHPSHVGSNWRGKTMGPTHDREVKP